MDLAVWLWPVSAAIVVAAVVAFGIGVVRGNTPLRRTWAIVAAGYAMPILVIAIGAVLRYDGPPPPQWIEPPEWRGWLLWAVLAANVIAIIAVGILTQGARIRATIVALPSVWLTASSVFVAAMAILGRGL